MRASPHDHRRLQIVATLLLVAARPASLTAQQPLTTPQPAATTTPHVALRYQIPASAIAALLASEGLTLSPDHLQLPLPVSATSPAPQLHIAAAEIRHDGTLQLRVLCRNAGECMPFFAIGSMPDRETAIAAIAGLHGISAPPAIANSTTPTTTPQHPQGITVGAHITLELTDPQMHIHLPAIAIDTGAPGTDIRVASLDRKHTWRGTVLDANTVQGGVQ